MQCTPSESPMGMPAFVWHYSQVHGTYEPMITVHINYAYNHMIRALKGLISRLEVQLSLVNEYHVPPSRASSD